MEIQYWILILIVVVAGAFAGYKIITNIRSSYNKVSSKNNSISAGRDVNINSNSDIKNQKK